MTTSSNHCWVIHDGVAGNRRQALALAEALEWPFQEKALRPVGLDKWLAPRLLPFARQAFGSAFAEAMREPPKYVIGCGRQAALATRLMRKAGSFAVQILNPRLDSRHWDVLIVPTHDGLQGTNVIQCLGSLHNVNTSSLTLWRKQTSTLQSMSSPRTAVLIGGPTRMAFLNEGLIEVMISHLEYDLARHGGTLMICGSRRTPKWMTNMIRQRFSGSGVPVWFNDEDGENPYRSLLANADRIVLTPDSVNMISEACATELPVFIAQPERAKGRMKIFLDHLLKIGRVKALGKEILAFPVTPLNTMPGVIAQLKGLLPP